MAATSTYPSTDASPHTPSALTMAGFVLCVINITLLALAYTHGSWVFESNGLGSPTDFVNVWSAGRLASDGTPALAWDWDIQKQVQVAVLGQSYPGHFAWHYPPPFLFVAAMLAQLPYAAAFYGWSALSFAPYALAIRAIVGRPVGLLLAAGFPVLFINTIIGQNGFLTAALIGGFLYVLPKRPVLAGVLLGLLSYKPQYGLLFPLALIAAGEWRAFASAAITTIGLAALSWLAFGTQSWQAFFHWLPMFSQAFLTEGRAPWAKLQSIYGLVRFCGGSEQLGWIFQWIMTATVAVTVFAIWRSRVRYTLKAAALATGTLLVTPYLFLYDQMVLAVAIAFLVRLGLHEGFRRHELPALGLALALLMFFPVFAAPTGFGATLMIAALVVARCRPMAAVRARLRPAPALQQS